MVTLRQLRYLAALARHCHFGRAAEACAITQPALSMQIRELEQFLGVTLVERRPGEVLLTELGREISRRAEDVLASARDLVDFARHRASPLTGRLTLGIIPSLAPYLLPRILPALQSKFPELQLELRETQTRLLVEEIKGGALDAAMLALPLGEPDIDTLELFNDLFLLAVPASDPRSCERRVAAQDIDQSRLILLEDGHCLRDQALSVCERSGAVESMEVRATSLPTLVQMVAGGMGVTLLPEAAAEALVQPRGPVELADLGKTPPGRTLGLAWRTSSARLREFRLLAETMSEAADKFLARLRS